MKTWSATLALMLAASAASADTLTCDLTGYKATRRAHGRRR